MNMGTYLVSMTFFLIMPKLNIIERLVKYKYFRNNELWVHLGKKTHDIHQ